MTGTSVPLPVRGKLAMSNTGCVVVDTALPCVRTVGVGVGELVTPYGGGPLAPSVVVVAALVVAAAAVVDAASVVVVGGVQVEPRSTDESLIAECSSGHEACTVSVIVPLVAPGTTDVGDVEPLAATGEPYPVTEYGVAPIATTA